MQLVKPSVEILTPINAGEMMKRIERAARVCYKSEDRITDESAPKFVQSLIKRGHLACIEHEGITIKYITDRGVLAEMTRHRIASYCVESTRYCDYNKTGDVQFIIPAWCKNLKEGKFDMVDSLGFTSFELDWAEAMGRAEATYKTMRKNGYKPEQARSVLPQSLKTEIVCTMNMRELQHFFNLRTARVAHPDMVSVATAAYDKLVAAGLGVFFEDIKPYRE